MAEPGDLEIDDLGAPPRASGRPRGVRPDKFVSDGSGIVLSQCQSCKHLIPGGLAVCDAFPSQIPQEMLDNEFDHRKPFEGDDGIRFEPRPGVPKPYLKALYAALDGAANG